MGTRQTVAAVSRPLLTPALAQLSWLEGGSEGVWLNVVNGRFDLDVYEDATLSVDQRFSIMRRNST